MIRGEARGYWFFEASFPVKLFDEAGNQIPLDPPYVMTASEWMTENFVPFETTHTFKSPKKGTGRLVLEKDNPSGLPENDDKIEIPVQFEEGSDNGDLKTCRRSGCSSQICSDQDVVTTCEFKPEYACYQKAECKVQAGGECGWTETEELKSCLANPE